MSSDFHLLLQQSISLSPRQKRIRTLIRTHTRPGTGAGTSTAIPISVNWTRYNPKIPSGILTIEPVSPLESGAANRQEGPGAGGEIRENFKTRQWMHFFRRICGEKICVEKKSGCEFEEIEKWLSANTSEFRQFLAGVYIYGVRSDRNNHNGEGWDSWIGRIKLEYWLKRNIFIEWY